MERETQVNYGGFVDLAAPGAAIMSASSETDDSFRTSSGTSQAAAMVAGAIALMKSQYPVAAESEIRACLKNSSTLLDSESSEYGGKLGAGALDISSSLNCLNEGVSAPSGSHPQGYIDLSEAAGVGSWQINLSPRLKGIWFYPPMVLENISPSATVEIYRQGNGHNQKLLTKFHLETAAEKFFVPETEVKVKVTGENLENIEGLQLEYRAEPIIFKTLYCNDIVYLREPGSFDDGSGSNPYSSNSDCKWQITAPPGKVIQLKFNSFDTESTRDLLYLFHGTGTHELIMAVLNGPSTPPELTSWGNEVLVWFVTDKENNRQGWSAEFTFVDPK